MINRMMKKSLMVFFLLTCVMASAFADHDEVEDMIDDATERVRRIVESNGIFARYTIYEDESVGTQEVTFASKGDIYYIKAEGEELYYDLQDDDMYYVYSYDEGSKTWSRRSADYSEYYDEYDGYYDHDDYDDYFENAYGIDDDDIRHTGGRNVPGYGTSRGKIMMKASLTRLLENSFMAFSSYADMFDDVKGKRSNTTFLGRKCYAYSFKRSYPGASQMFCECIVDRKTGLCLKISIRVGAQGKENSVGFECNEIKIPYTPALPAKFASAE